MRPQIQLLLAWFNRVYHALENFQEVHIFVFTKFDGRIFVYIDVDFLDEFFGFSSVIHAIFSSLFSWKGGQRLLIDVLH